MREPQVFLLDNYHFNIVQAPALPPNTDSQLHGSGPKDL